VKSYGRHPLPEVRERILTLIGTGQYIPAIKLVREVTGLGLKDAKDYVDGLKGEAYARVIPPDVEGKARSLLAEGRRKDAVKLVRAETGLDSRGAKDYVKMLQAGLLPAASASGESSSKPSPWGRGTLSDRVRAMKRLGDHESAIAMVCAETGMNRDEARTFVDALR